MFNNVMLVLAIKLVISKKLTLFMTFKQINIKI